MDFDQALIPGELRRRYKRFLADVRLDDGTDITCHCPNTGSMLGCQEPGSRVWLSISSNPKRKYAHTWELVDLPEVGLVGIHTGRPNALVREAIAANLLPSLAGYGLVRPEVTLPGGETRVDFLLQGHPKKPDCFLEVKNVTAAVTDSVALFPDAVSSRATRHLQALRGLVAAGQRAMLVFCVQRQDVRQVQPFDAVDPAYGLALREAIRDGVEVHALRARLSTRSIQLDEPIPVVCPPLVCTQVITGD